MIGTFLPILESPPPSPGRKRIRASTKAKIFAIFAIFVSPNLTLKWFKEYPTIAYGKDRSCGFSFSNERGQIKRRKQKLHFADDPVSKSFYINPPSQALLAGVASDSKSLQIFPCCPCLLSFLIRFIRLLIQLKAKRLLFIKSIRLSPFILSQARCPCPPYPGPKAKAKPLLLMRYPKYLFHTATLFSMSWHVVTFKINTSNFTSDMPRSPIAHFMMTLWIHWPTPHN